MCQKCNDTIHILVGLLQEKEGKIKGMRREIQRLLQQNATARYRLEAYAKKLEGGGHIID